jgi:hypothetical protein
MVLNLTQFNQQVRLVRTVFAPACAIIGAMLTAGISDTWLNWLRDRPVLRQFPDNQDLFLVATLLLAAEMYALQWIRLLGPRDQAQVRGLRCLFILLLVPASLWCYQMWRDPDSEALVKELRSRTWIGYDTMDFDPVRRPSPRTDTIRRDLLWIKQAHFTGIITFSS